MAWYDGFFVEPERPEALAPLSVPARAPRYKVDFHIERFERAIAQCEKPAKLVELQANLAYWRAIRAAEAAIEGRS